MTSESLLSIVGEHMTEAIHEQITRRGRYSDATPPTIGDVDAARLRRADRLGGLIHEYRIAA